MNFDGLFCFAGVMVTSLFPRMPMRMCSVFCFSTSLSSLFTQRFSDPPKLLDIQECWMHKNLLDFVVGYTIVLQKSRVTEKILIKFWGECLRVTELVLLQECLAVTFG